MTWAWPERLWWMLLVIPVGTLLFFALRRRARDLHQLVAAGVFAGLVPQGVGRIRVAQGVMLTLAVGLIGVALAGPRLGFDWQQRKVEGVSIVAVLDVSKSMDAADDPPSRLDRARRELEDLAGMLRNDSIGLVIFAAGAYARIPLTVDYDTFVWAVRDSSAETLQAQGTSLAGAITLGVQLLDGVDGRGKAMVIVSDGEGHDQDPALQAAVAAAVEAGVYIYTLGVGTPEGAPIPLPGGGFKKDNLGNVVLSRLEESVLQNIASATGGAYVRAVPSDDDVRAVYDGEIRARLEASERGMRREKVWREQYQVPLGVALLLLIVQAALSVRWRRPAVTALVLLGLGLSLPDTAWAGPREDGFEAVKNQKWEEAVRALAQASLDDPADREVARALGEALYRTGRFRDSEQVFRRLAAGADSAEQQAVDTFNAGNAAYRGGRLDEALRRYQEAAQIDPSLEAATKNAEAVAKEIEARKNPPPPKEGDKKPNEGGGEQQDPQSGEPQPGEPQPGAPQPQDAPPQQPQSGESGDPGSGSAGEPAGQASPQAGETTGKAEPGAEPGAAPPEGAPSGTVEAEGAADSGQSADPNAPEPGERGMVRLTADQAARLVDSVQEGKPRVRVSGQESEKDW